MILYKASGNLQQDKAASNGGLSASPEPRLVNPPSQAKPKHRQRKNYEVKGRVNAPEFSAIENMKGVGNNALSRQAVVTQLIRTGLAVALDNQHFTMLEPRVVQTIDRKMDEYINRTTKLLIDILKIAKQGELLEEEVIATIHKDDPKQTHKIVTQARNKARGSL